MDFARKQLEKYGWSDGKGLGKNENGISEALKPKLKRSVTGIGHDPASEFNEHWWTALYDKASKNVEVEDKNGKTKKIKTKDTDDFIITSSTWKINKKKSNPTDESEYSEFFVRTAVLTNDKGGRKTENVKSDSEEDVEKRDVFKMTDEELFAACEGRTAHKGARHGLRAIGKLARIAEQEQALLTQPRFQGYSHAKKMKREEETIEQMSLEDVSKVQKKKKKRKHCNNTLVESESLPEILKSNDGDASEKKHGVSGNTDVKKKKKHKIELKNDASVNENDDEQMAICDAVDIVKKSKKRKNGDKTTEIQIVDTEALESNIKKKKKKKVKDE